VTAARRALERLEWIADAYLSVSPLQRALPELLALAPRLQAAINARLSTNRRVLCEALAGLPVRVHADAGWYACLRLVAPVQEEELVGKLASEHGVLVHPGYFYDFADEGVIVVSLLVPEDRLERGARSLAAGLKAL
jgi:alanine-synthesizing transaminase